MHLFLKILNADPQYFFTGIRVGEYIVLLKIYKWCKQGNADDKADGRLFEIPGHKCGAKHPHNVESHAQMADLRNDVVAAPGEDIESKCAEEKEWQYCDVECRAISGDHIDGKTNEVGNA